MRIHACELLPGAKIRVRSAGVLQTVLQAGTEPENPELVVIETDQDRLFLPRRRLVYLEGAVI